MWPYIAGAVVALGGLWKLAAILRCKREDIPKVAGALTNMVTLRLPWPRRNSEPPDDRTASAVAGSLDLRTSVGAAVDGFVIIAVVPHATLPQTWAVAGRKPDGAHATWTASVTETGSAPRVVDRSGEFDGIEDAFADMLRRART